MSITRFRTLNNEVWEMPESFNVAVVVCKKDSESHIKILNSLGEYFTLEPGTSLSFHHTTRSREPLRVDATGANAQVAWEN